jgi:urease accessory protein
VRSTLLLLADGRFPAGGHAYSAGVEAAVRLGDVADLPSLERYLAARLASTGTTDAAFAVATWSAVDGGATELAGAVARLDREYAARVPAPHLRATSRRLGRQLARAARSVWPDPIYDVLGGVDPDGAHQAIVLGATVAVAGGDATDAAAISIHHLATAVTTSAVRLLGLDPLAVAAVQARGVARRAIETEAGAWIDAAPDELPALGGTLTEVLGEDHGGWDARLFAA